MRINNLSERFESDFLHSVISNTFGVEGLCGSKIAKSKEDFCKICKTSREKQFLSQISQQDFKTLFSTGKNFDIKTLISSSLCV